MDLIKDKGINNGDEEEEEEDFGELYAEVEAQATSAIIGTAPEAICQPENENHVFNSHTESTRSDSDDEEDDDDDDDDLNILLNDDVCQPRSSVVYKDEEEHHNHNHNDRCLESDKSLCPPQINKTTNSVSRYGCSGFTLPSYWTIMDVDIDVLREKPWRCPGVDLTHYFNFGLDEDTWKQYRNSLTRKVEPEHCKVSKMEVEGTTRAAQGRKRSPELPRGRAIEVQSSLYERQSSMDVKSAHIEDSDVIIQLTVQETDEGHSGSGKEENYQKDSDVTSKDGVSHVIDNIDVSHCDSANGDVPVGSPKEILGKTFRKRCSECRTASSNQISSDGENQNKTIHISDVFESIQEKAESDPSITETIFSASDRNRLSLTPSCFGSDEASVDEIFDKPVKVDGVFSGAKMHDSVKPDGGFKMKVRVVENNLRYKSPFLEERKRDNRKIHGVYEQKLYPEKDEHPVHRRDVEGDREHYKRREARFEEDWEDYSRKGCNVTNWKVHNGTEHGMDQFSRNSSRQSNRWYDNSHDDRDDSSCFRDVKARDPFGEVYKGTKDELLSPQTKQRFCQRRSTLENEDVLDRDLKYHGRMSPQFERWSTEREDFSERGSTIVNEDVFDRDLKHRGRMRPQFKERWTEREHSNERFSEIVKEDILDSDLKHYARRFSTWRTIPLRCRNPRGSTFDFKGSHNFFERSVDSPQFRHEDEFVEGKFSSRGADYQLNRGSYKTFGGRWRDMMSPTSDTLQFTSITKYEKCERLVSDKFDRDCSWFGRYNDIDDFENDFGYSYEKDHLERRRYNLHGVRYWDDQLYANEERYSRENLTMHERVDDKFETTHRGMLIDNCYSHFHKHKKIRRSENNLDRNLDVICRDNELEQTILRDTDSTHFTVSKGKSAGRFSASGHLAGNRGPAKMDRSHAKEKSSNCFREPRARRALAKFPINDSKQNNEIWLDKFPVMVSNNKDTDIEEGQIISKEQTVKDYLNKKRNFEGLPTKKNVKKKISLCESGLNGNAVVEELDNKRMLETIAKMEKRRERFKDPVTLKSETERIITLAADLDSTTETKQVRPARKRCWGGR